MTKQAVIYTRFSPRPNAKECDSCEKQGERCQAYCKQRGYAWGCIHTDKNKSGSNLDRPALARAIDLLRFGEADILVVDSSDRLARDMLVNLTIRQQVADAGATIEFADGSPCDTTPEGKLFQNMLAAFAAYERDRIRLRTKNGLEKKRKNGERTTGKIPIGWMLNPDDPKRLVVCEQERGAIKLMCRLASQDHTSEWIRQALNEAIGPCRGKSWSSRTIRRLIKRHAFWADPLNGNPKLELDYP